MPSPSKHPRTGIYQFRQRVPTDLLGVVGMKEITRSLGTKDPQEAKTLHAVVAVEVAGYFSNLRLGERRLSFKHIRSLAGEFYRECVARHDDEPGSPAFWIEELRVDRVNARVWRNRPNGLISRFAQMAEEFLATRGIALEESDRRRFVKAVSEAKILADEQILRNAQGDYRPDPDAARFPTIAPAPKPQHRFDAVWERYAKDKELAEKTVRKFFPILKEMVTFVGKTDLGAITEEDLLRWRDMLEARPGLTSISIKNGRLAAAKALFGWMAHKRILPTNPTQNVHVSVKRKGKKMRGFTLAEANTILSACLAPANAMTTVEHAAARRWVPWLCAYTGARVNEITQLRASDVHRVEDIWVIRITQEAGTVKTGVQRGVPLHSHLIELGFVDFAKGKRGDEPLFYTPNRKPSGEGGRPRYETVGNKLSEWVRGLGISDPSVAPNHGWRHRFKTNRRRYGMDGEITDAIQGHAPASEGARYGETDVVAMKREIEKIPRYDAVPGAVVDRRMKASTKNRVQAKAAASPVKRRRVG